MGRGVFSPADCGVWGGSWAPPKGSAEEHRPETHFGIFWKPENALFAHICWCCV